jgi:hypothetical protein
MGGPEGDIGGCWSWINEDWTVENRACIDVILYRSAYELINEGIPC